MSDKKYLICLPAYNEAHNIKTVLETIRNKFYGPDILVINDGSTDNTNKVFGQFTGLTIINHTSNKGYGQSLIEGFNYAIKWQYTYVITLDCDLQHDPAEINKFIAASSPDFFDIISGSRYLQTTPEQMRNIPESRFYINQRITQYINSLSNYNITDAFCGFKLYKVSALSNLHLNETGYGFPLQLWLQAHKNQLRVKEIPVKLIYFNKTQTLNKSSFTVFRRYKYYLSIIQKELQDYEYYDYSSSSGRCGIIDWRDYHHTQSER